jgi:hypothetical protein
MRTKMTFLAVLLSAGVGGCGGGNDSPIAAPLAVNSVDTFEVRSTFDRISSDGLNLNLVGTDNAQKTSNLNGYNDWTGTFSMSKREVTTAFLAGTTNCANATILIDARLTLLRSRDGYRMQEAATFGYDDNYKPLCAMVLDGHYWTWNLSEELPERSLVKGNLTGVQFSGVSSFTPDALNIDSNLTGLVGLDADTANSAYLSFTYHVTPPGTAALPFRMLGENTDFRFRIDPMGKVLGFQYVRTGIVPDPMSNTPVTLTMNSR